ncbi:MAG: ABC transporter permease subunit [Candidatus Limiplasma sp.]|nr:ABC transporter permease subunit [Candidatus Limiplasma sp.]
MVLGKRNTAVQAGQRPLGSRLKRELRANKYIYLMLAPVVLYYVVFHYIPMGGSVIAFQNYKPAKGFWGSDWVGLKHFEAFFASPYAWRVIRNTLLLSVYQIIFGFPMPIVLALMVNEVRCKPYKKFVQTVSYMPHFISLVVICSLLLSFSRTDGLFNDIVAFLGGERTNLFAREELFRSLFVGSGIWQTIGWGSIIYLATLSTVDPSLHEAAAMDGATRLKRMIHVSFPALVPVIIVQLIMRLGNILSQGFEKVMLLYSPLIYETSDVISTYVYRRGLQDMNYSFGAAVGIFNSVVNLAVLFWANSLSRRLTRESLW